MNPRSRKRATTLWTTPSGMTMIFWDHRAIAAMRGAGPTANPRRSPGPRILEKDLQIVTVRSSPNSERARFQRLPRRGSVESEVAVRLVLEDEDAIRARDADELQPPGQAHCPAARVLEIGNGIDEFDGSAFGLRGGDGVADAIDNEAFLIHRRRGKLRPAGREGDQGAVEGGRLADDNVSRVNECPGEKIDGVGRAVGDDDLVGTDAGFAFVAEDLPLEDGVAFGRAVLEDIRAVGRDHLLKQAGQQVRGERLGAGQAAGERDHPLDAFRRLQHFADERDAHRAGRPGQDFVGE